MSVLQKLCQLSLCGLTLTAMAVFARMPMAGLSPVLPYTIPFLQH